MNLNNPETCRTLAAMIQQIAPESREQFRSDAEEAPDMETFMRGLNQYKTVKFLH